MKAEAVSRSSERRRWPIGLRRASTCPSCYPRLVQTGLHQTGFPTLCWFETDRLRMGGIVRPLIPAQADIPTHILGVAKRVSQH